MPVGRVDVAIAGGGPAGAAAGIVLARAGLRVLIADGRRDDPAARGRTLRIGEGLPPSARHLLRELGVLERVDADGHRASPGILAFWGSDTPHTSDFLYQLHGQGLQLDRERFDATLLDVARRAGAEVVGSAYLRLEAGAAGRTPHRLTLCSEKDAARPLEARWILDATGRNATLARALGAKAISYDRLLAFHQRLVSDTGTDQDGRTWIEAVEAGWWYSVLLPSRKRLVAFLCDADSPVRHALLGRPEPWRMLQDAPALRDLCALHGYAPDDQARGANACSAELDLPVGRNWMAVGDAALAFDPLSSRGIASALYTGSQAANAVIASGQGDTEAPARYATHVRDIHRVYRDQLHHHYAMERRWPESVFWRRRICR